MTLLGMRSLHSVAASLVVAYVPHFIRTFAVIKPKMVKEGKPYNIFQSRLYVQQYSDNSPQGLLITRLTGCHQNGLEAFAYFAAAVLGGLAAGLDKEYLDTMALTFVGIRILYTINYIAGYSPNARPLLWMSGILISLTLLIQAGNKLSE